MASTLERASLQQRAAAATAELKRILGLDDLKLLSAAVAEVAAAEAAASADFAARIRSAYTDLAALRGRRSRSAAASPSPRAQLTPLPGSEGARFDPFAPLDPYVLLRLYGLAQLRDALSAYSLAALREATAAVQAHNPTTQPKDRRTKAALISYIVDCLT